MAPLLVTPVDKAKWERQTRAANACRRAFLGQDYLPQPALWKIADADTTLYLYGTVHLLPVGFEWRTPQLDRIVSEAQYLITESGLPSNADLFGTQPKTSLFVQAAGSSVPIAERVTGEQRAKWIGMVAMLPDEVASRIDRLPSWLAAVMISSLPERHKPPSMTKGVDDQLTTEFGKVGKSVAAMEDSKVVAAALAAIPEAVQRQMLVQALDRVGQKRTFEQRMELFHRWAKGDALFTLEPDLPEELRNQLLNVRNGAWVDMVKQRLAQPGVMLVAVGAAHLRGDGSLIDLLAKQGMTAERVSPTAAPLPRPKFMPTPKNWKECDLYQFGRETPESGAD